MNSVRAFTSRVPQKASKPVGESTQVAPLKALPQDQALVKGFEFALSNILQGQITTEDQLRALINPQFDNQGYLRFNGKDVQFTINAYIKITDLNGACLSQEAFDLLNRNRTVIRGGTISAEVQANLRTYLQTGDETNLQRIIIVAEASGDDTLSTDTKSLVADIQKNSRTSKLKQEVYKGIVEGQTPENLLAVTTNFQPQDASETRLVAQLQRAIIAKRIQDKVVSASASLQSPTGNIEPTLEIAVGLLKANTDEERLAGLTLTKSAYGLELANFRREIFNRVSQGLNLDANDIRNFIAASPKRASIDNIDYLAEVLACRNRTDPILEGLLKQRNFARATKIREGFEKDLPTQVAASINELAANTPDALAIKAQLTDFYRAALAGSRPGIFDTEFAPQIRAATQADLERLFMQPDLKDNQAAADYLLGNFLLTMYPLAEVLRADPATADQISNFLGQDAAIKFTQRLIELEKQRELTDIERQYIRSVERLTDYNAHMVACATVSPAITAEFLRQHFNKISQATIAGLQDGDYVPAVQIGLGPNGLTGLGEILRNNPKLASSMLVVDAGKQPGGPFAIPEGPAWELNSANGRGSGARVMPAAPGANELQTVRAYGSPVTRWYPGERSPDSDVRFGSINTTVDYLPTPDDISTSRYPTNEELALVLSMQAAMLINKLALQTRFVKLEKNPDPHSAGDKILTLEINDQNGKRQIKLRTDAVFLSSGLGDDGYGFELAGSRAEKVIEQTQNMPLPKLAKTLQAFKVLASRLQKPVALGKTLVIYGRGNSADTLLEYIGSIFQSNNSNVRNIEKVYVVCDGNLSARPRYAQINDLKPRNGRGNFIEQINARVQDVDFASEDGDPSTRRLNFYDTNDNLINDDSGSPLLADFAIAATGFRSKIDTLLAEYVQESGADPQDALRAPLTLPTNSRVAVAETLKADPSVLILGTASKPFFESGDKLAQLPREAREALLRNGAENAVAIGFRAPDTQAAINIWLNMLEVSVEAAPSVIQKEKIVVDASDKLEPGEKLEVEAVLGFDDIVIPNNIQDERLILSPLFVYNIGNAVELTNPDKSGYQGKFKLALTLDDERKLELKSSSKIPRKLAEAIKRACEDRDFQNYALAALRRKRGSNPSLQISLFFNKGRIVPFESFVEV